MQRRLASLIVPALLVACLIPLAARPASAVELSTPSHPLWLEGIADIGVPAPRPTTCTVWTGTDYYSDAALTNRVGVCTVTCTQATHGIVEPTFTGGGACTGTSGPYTVRRYFGCPGICP